MSDRSERIRIAKEAPESLYDQVVEAIDNCPLDEEARNALITLYIELLKNEEE